MLRAYSKYLWIVAAVALLLTVGASTSEAFWHHHGCGCAACCLKVVDPCCPPVLPMYSVAYSPCCPTFDCALGIRPGPIRRAVFGPYRMYCGYNLGVPAFYSGWAPSVAAPCCEPTPANGVLTPTPATPTPAKPQTPPAAAPTGPITPKATSVERQDAGQITIWVPETAKVYVNGLETKSTGNLRQFVSYGLKPGMTYDYTIRAVVVRDGRSIEESHSIKLVAGQRSAVAFNFNKPANSSLASIW